VEQSLTALQQKRLSPEFWITPPQTFVTEPMWTNPSVLPNLPPPVDPDANEEGDDENTPSDAPGEVGSAANEVRAGTNGGTKGAAGISTMLHKSKSSGLPKASIVNQNYAKKNSYAVAC
jgi:hypothetical protein